MGIQFKMTHCNFNVLSLEASMRFYLENFGLTETDRIETPEFTIVYLGNPQTDFMLELTWLANRTEPYQLGDNETHLAFTVNQFAAAHAIHERSGIICHENPDMGVYFVSDPDGYWIEVLPEKNR